MNIGIFTDTYMPQVNGVVTVIRNLENELINLGHNVYIFTVNHPDAVSKDNVYRFPSVKFIWEPQHRIGITLSPSVTRKIKDLNLDIIHTHTEFSLQLYARYISSHLNIPTVHTFHTYYDDYLHYVPIFERFLKIYAKSEVKKIANRQKIAVAPSKKIKALLESYEVSSPIEIVPNGIDLSKFYSEDNSESQIAVFKDNFGIKDSDRVLVFVGRIAQEKSVDKLLINMKKICDIRKDVKLLLIGDGPEKHALKKMASELDIDRNIIFTGYIKWPDEIKIAYKVADIFISASHSEVHPMTFIEALATGLPIVALDDPSIEDMIENDFNGYKVKEQTEIWEKVLSIIDDKEMLEKFSCNSYDISKKYSSKVFTENMLKVYEKALGIR